MSDRRAPLTVENVDAPGLKLDSPERIDLGDLVGGGLAITVELAQLAELQLALRSVGIEPLEAGARGSVDRPRLTTLATSSPSAPAGRSEHRLALDSEAIVLLEGAPVEPDGIRARLVAQARTGDGRILVANRRLRIVSTA